MDYLLPKIAVFHHWRAEGRYLPKSNLVERKDIQRAQQIEWLCGILTNRRPEQRRGRRLSTHRPLKQLALRPDILSAGFQTVLVSVSRAAKRRRRHGEESLWTFIFLE